jgi:two-component system CheB/CheR fusion protein
MGTTNDKPGIPFVVCIGGSAGSLDVLERFFSDIPAGNGLTFAVAIHSIPERVDYLSEILGKFTSMPSVSIDENVDLQPDRIHVIRYQRDQGQMHHSIDRYFQSMAEKYGSSVIAVVLSGGGNDGSQGALKVIDQGGIVLVQDPDQSQYPDMPKNVINACHSVEVVPPDLISTRVMDIARIMDSTPKESDLVEHIQTIFQIIRNRTGNDFSAYKTNTVLRRIDRRMKENGVTEVVDYVSLLDENTDEVLALSRDFCIGVTAFFRDYEAFEILYKEVIPQLYAGRAHDDQIRIWDTCCATGEESYSLAMLLHDYAIQNNSVGTVKLFATDLDDSAISIARNGVYSESSVANIDKKRLSTYFQKMTDGYQVSKSIREMIIFAQHNLIKDPPFSRLDMVVCRNFFIYLNTDVQKKLLTLFYSMLRPDGFLFMGNSESIGTLTELFQPLDKRWRIFKRREAGPLTGNGFRLTHHIRTLSSGFPSPFQNQSREPDPGYIADQVLVRRFAPPSFVVNEKYEVVHVCTPSSRLLEVPLGEPTRDIFRMVREEIRPALRAAIHKALTTKQQVIFHGRGMIHNGEPVMVEVTSEPLDMKSPGRKLALVTLRPLPLERSEHFESLKRDVQIPGEDGKDQLIRDLEEQLHVSQDELNATIEQLAASNDNLVSTNEELMSVNEEFQSTNEELETSKEELQTLNEELITLNTELQKKVEALDVANSDIENLLNGTRIATLFLDSHLRVKRFTPAASEIFNLIQSDINRPIEHITGKISHLNITSDALTVMGSDMPYERTVKSVTGDRTYLMRMLPYKTLHGKAEGVVVTFVDLTDQQRMEEALLEQARILDLAPVMVRSLDGRIVLWNTGAERIYGYTRDEAVGQVSHQVLKTIFPEPHEHIMDVLYRDDVWSGELRHFGKNGQQITVASQWVMYRNGDGKPSKILEVNSDITELKKVEDRFRNLFNEILDGYILTDISCDENEGPSDYRIVAFNPAFAKIAEQESENIIGRRLFDVMPGIEDAGREIFLHVAKTGDHGHFNFNCSHHQKYIDITVFRPDIGQLAVMFADRTKQFKAETERSKLEVQLRHSQKMEAIGILAGGIAHDFNNILGAILGYNELARDGGMSPADREEHLEQVALAASRAKDLVRQILIFSRQVETHKSPIQPAKLIRETLKFLRPSLPSTIDIVQNIECEDSLIFADPTHIHQILMNLCTNAFHAMEEKGGTLNVILRRKDIKSATLETHPYVKPGAFAELVVQDNGPGIPPEIREKVFDPYFTTKEIGKGTGMGLAIVHGIVQSCGGFIDCSTVVGQGTLFKVYFPIIDNAVYPEKEYLKSEPPGGDERILFVDDEERLASLGQIVLEKLGYTVTSVTTASDALAIFKNHPHDFDVVVTDYTMPKMTGMTLAKKLMAIRPDIPVIMCTGYSHQVSEEKARLSGIQGFIMKPITKYEIGFLIRKVLDKDKAPISR